MEQTRSTSDGRFFRIESNELDHDHPQHTIFIRERMEAIIEQHVINPYRFYGLTSTQSRKNLTLLRVNALSKNRCEREPSHWFTYKMMTSITRNALDRRFSILGHGA